MVADLLSAPPASSAEPAGSDRRTLFPQRALPELVLATRGEAEHAGARGALSAGDGGGAAGAGPYGHRGRGLVRGPTVRLLAGGSRRDTLPARGVQRSEEHTYELQSLMRN